MRRCHYGEEDARATGRMIDQKAGCQQQQDEGDKPNGVAAKRGVSHAGGVQLADQCQHQGCRKGHSHWHQHSETRGAAVQPAEVGRSVRRRAHRGGHNNHDAREQHRDQLADNGQRRQRQECRQRLGGEA